MSPCPCDLCQPTYTTGFVLEVTHTYSNNIFKLSHEFFERGTVFYVGETKLEVKKSTADIETLENVRPISDSAFPSHNYDLFGEPFTMVPNEYYLQRPFLMNYLVGEAATSKRFENEATVLRSIRKHPHQSLAIPVRSIVRRGRVLGFVFKCYEPTLLDLINSTESKCDSIFTSIERGLTHLHNIGLCHNDVHVGNVMLDELNRPVLIDFEFAAVPGTKLPSIGKTASTKVDLASLARMKWERANGESINLFGIVLVLRCNCQVHRVQVVLLGNRAARFLAVYMNYIASRDDNNNAVRLDPFLFNLTVRLVAHTCVTERVVRLWSVLCVLCVQYLPSCIFFISIIV